MTQVSDKDDTKTTEKQSSSGLVCGQWIPTAVTRRGNKVKWTKLQFSNGAIHDHVKMDGSDIEFKKTGLYEIHLFCNGRGVSQSHPDIRFHKGETVIKRVIARPKTVDGSLFSVSVTFLQMIEQGEKCFVDVDNDAEIIPGVYQTHLLIKVIA